MPVNHSPPSPSKTTPAKAKPPTPNPKPRHQKSSNTGTGSPSVRRFFTNTTRRKADEMEVGDETSTGPTPQKAKYSTDDVMVAVLALHKRFDVMDGRLEEIESKQEAMEAKVETLENEMQLLRKENYILQLNTARIQAEAKKNFLVIHGLPEVTSEEVKAKVTEYIHVTLRLPQITPDECRKFGNTPADNSKVRPTSVRFADINEREAVFTASRKIKHPTIAVYTHRPKILRDEAKKRRTAQPQRQGRPPGPK